MRTTKHLSDIKPTSSSTFHHVVAILTVAAGLFVGTATSRAGTYTWTNTVSDYWADPQAWGTNTFPGPADDATFSFSVGTPSFTVTFTNTTTVDSIDVRDTKGQTLTFDLQGNTVSLYKSGTTQPTIFLAADPGGSTAIVYIVSSTTPGTLWCTNTAAVRFSAGRSGNGTIVVTNMTLIVGGPTASGSAIMGNSSGPGSQGHIVLSGPTTYWTNNATCAVGNNTAASQNSLVISNSASMTCVGQFKVDWSGGGTANSLLIDTGGRLFTRAACNIGSLSGANNSATVQGGGLWDLNGMTLALGVSGTGNSLTIGANAAVTNLSTLTIVPGNSLVLSGGVLTASIGVTNTSSTITGFGTISANVQMNGTGTLTLGLGNTVGTNSIGNNLTLTANSTTVMKLDKRQSGSNDFLNVIGALTEAGALTINNVGAALVGGDTFQLVAAGAKTGDFSTTNLPSLSPGLLWNTSQLGPQGIISVVLPPSITGPAGQATNVGTTVVISTTVTGVPAPTAQWQYNGVNTTDGPTGNGSTISGSTTPTLTVSNAQTNDSGVYCLIASNIGGSVTNCMQLTVANGLSAPTITGPTDQTVIQGNYGTFSASAAGIPSPTVQWQQNGVNISGATATPLILTNVQYSQDGYVYSIIASNVVGSITNSATLHVIVTPVFITQPTNYIATVGQGASFSVSATGVPAPTYQWYFNNNPIGGATGPTYTIASVTAANAGTYYATAINAAGTVPSSSATLTVLSTMTPLSLTPANGGVNVCYDTPLYITFSQAPLLQDFGKIRIYNVTNPATPVDTLDMTQNVTNNVPYAVNVQQRTIGGEPIFTFPVIISGNTAAMYPHLDILSSNQTYFVTVDQGVFTDTNGALFAGITTTNGWVFTTKPTGPANPTNIVVAADGSGDFVTVQGAVDSLPANNTTPTLVNIRNGTYTEVVDTKGKNYITFRGQSRAGAIVGYANNNYMNGTTHYRMAFKIYANNLAVENMTIVNTTPQGGQQAEALELDTGATRFILNNAEVDSRQDTIYANGTPQTQGYFYNSLVQGNYDYIWGGGNLFITNCQFQTIPTTSQYNLCAPRTDNNTIPGEGWISYDGTHWSSNGFSFVNCLLTRSSSTVSNITMSDSNGNPFGVASWIYCHIDTTGGNGFIVPVGSVISNQILWEYGNSNLDNSASVTFGFLNPLTNGDVRLACASSATCWLNGWVPQLAPNILTNPVSMTVTAGMTATFSVAATGIPDPSYQWLFNTTNVLAGATNATLSITNALAANAGAYSVIVSNIAGTVTSSSATLTVVGTGPTASFTASPTSGTEPLGVTFTDTSSGSPNITLFWDFGDNSQATNASGSSFVHTYAAGTYTVTLTASNAFGANSTLVSNNLINVVSVFQAWQQQYFGCTGCPQAQPNADPLGKGISNTNQFLLGLNPTDPASVFRILSVVPQGTNMVITWASAGVRTNAVQATAGDGNGGYVTTNFADISVPPITIAVTGDATNSYTDVGGAANSPARYYRIRLVP
jgi:PKD repeat protein